MKTLLKKTFAVLCVLLFASLFAREAKVFHSHENLVIDGQLDEAAWQEAQEHSGFVINGSTELEPEKTSFKVINTPEGIVLGISMRDGFIKSRPRPHDDQVWADDCIDIFIAPVEEFSTDQNVREFYHFILNADNARYDAHIRGGVADAARNFRWHSATAKTEEGWQAEVMLPFYNFNVAENGIPQVWRFNLIRENRTENSNTVSAWKPTLQANDSDNFGKLSGIQGDVEFFNLELGNIKMSRTGEEASLEFEVRGKAGRSLEALGVLRREGETLLRRNTLRCQGEQNATKANIAFPMMESGKYELEMLLLDEKGNTVYHENRDLQVDFSKVIAQLLHPPYRNSLYASDPRREIELNLIFRGLPEEQRELTWQIVLESESGQQLYDKHHKGSRVIIPVEASWPKGKYNCRVQASSGDQAELSVRLLSPAAGSEVIINSKGQMLVDGKLFFGRGFMGVGGQTDLAGLAKQGCNTFHSYVQNRAGLEETLAVLDKYQELGLKLMLYPYAKIPVGFWGIRQGEKYLPRFSEEQMQQIGGFVKALQNHPALLGWYLFDEPRGAQWCDELQRVYEFIKEIDPYHPVFGCDNTPGSCIALQDHCDVLMLDMYLNPYANGEPSISVSSIVGACQKVIESIQGRAKCFWFVPQAYDSDSFRQEGQPRERRAPSAGETLASVWGSIAVGAQGILPYKIGNPDVIQPGKRHANAGVYASEELRAAYLESIMPELRSVESFVLMKTPQPEKAPLLKATGSLGENRGEAILLVNPTPQKVPADSLTMQPYEKRWLFKKIKP